MTNQSPAQTSLQEFDENIRYAKALIAGGIALLGLQNFPAHPEDLYRAAWNQAVAAMDHWMHDELIQRAVNLANDTGNVRPQAMRNLKMPFEMVERMRLESSHVVFRDFLKEEFGRRSFHGTTDITAGVKLVSHLSGDEIWRMVGSAAGMTLQQAKQCHNDVIKRRNDISHRADRDVSGQRQPMTEDQAAAAIDWIDNLVHTLHTLLG